MQVVMRSPSRWSLLLALIPFGSAGAARAQGLPSTSSTPDRLWSSALGGGFSLPLVD